MPATRCYRGTRNRSTHCLHKYSVWRKTFSKKVAPDLLGALRALREPRQDRWLWADAICIDQANVDEKNLQIETISKIYGQAESLYSSRPLFRPKLFRIVPADHVSRCIWLGESDSATSMAFNFIQREVLEFQDFGELCDTNYASRKWGAVLDLFQRQWFSRRWVVQEIALARKAMIYCGLDEMSWTGM